MSIVTNATIMREYFKTGHVFGTHSEVFKLEDFAAEYTGYVNTGHVPAGFGKHRDHSYDSPAA
ncbi:hypothetical protein ACIPY0_20435 [Paenarthrobacter nicotinovorans]|uniref:hypothetical protein n=1 Tax=Paenarthrobacter nicotinovorans TaxID=29320 RepID=UPI0038075C5C